MKTKTIIYLLILVIFAITAAVVVRYFNALPTEDLSVYDVTEVEDESKEYDYQPLDHKEVVVTIEEIINNPDTDLTEKAQQVRWNAESYVISDGFSLDGIKKYVQEMKSYVANEELSPKERAKTLQTLATSYCAFARDPRIPEIVYDDEVYGPYKVEGDPSQSGKNLLEWSHSIYPLPKSAATIAHWYAKSSVDDNYSREQQLEFAALTRKWILESEQLNESELEITGGNNTHTAPHAGYLYWRAFSIAVLTMSGQWEGGVDDWRNAYDEFFGNSRRSDLTWGASQYNEFASLMYGYFVREIDGNDAQADFYLQESVDLFEDTYKSDLDRQFPRSFLFHYQLSQGDIIWDIFMDARKRSPLFNQMVTRVLNEDKIDRTEASVE